MKKLLPLFVLAALSVQSAHANSIIQFAGEQACRGTNPLAVLTPGVDTPSAGDTYTAFAPYLNDLVLSNYKIVAGVLTHIPTGLTAKTVSGNVIWATVSTGTLVNGTAGSFFWAEQVDPTTGVKRIVAAFNGFTQSAQVVTFPVPFAVKPSIVSTTLSGVSAATLTASGITFTATNVNGTVVIEGI